MCQDEALDLSRGGERSRCRGREMSIVTRHGGIATEERGLDDEDVGPAYILGQSLRGFGITDNDELSPALRWPEDIIAPDRSAVGQPHRPSLCQLLAHGTVRHCERGEAVRLKMT